MNEQEHRFWNPASGQAETLGEAMGAGRSARSQAFWSLLRGLVAFGRQIVRRLIASRKGRSPQLSQH